MSNDQITSIKVQNKKKKQPTPKPKMTPTPKVTPTSTLTGTNKPTILKIGLDLPLSGADSSFGQSAENGALLAINQANGSKALPGYTLQLVAKDDANSSSGQPDAILGVQNVTSLLQDAQVAGIIGAFDTTTAEAELPIANKASVGLISPSSTSTCLTQASATACGTLLNTIRPTGKTTFFRLAPTDMQQGEALADFAYTTKFYRNVYVIDDATAYGVGLANGFINRFQANSGLMVGHTSTAPIPAYLNLLTQIATTRPDAIFYAGNESQGVTIRQQMFQIPALKNASFFGGNGIHTAIFANALSLLGGSPIYSSSPSLTLTNSTFVQQYQAAYGTPGVYSAAGYDSANMLLAALKATIAGKVAAPNSSTQASVATTFRAAVVSTLMQTSYTSVTGIHYTFTATGDVLNNAVEMDTLSGTQWITNTNVPVVQGQ